MDNITIEGKEYTEEDVYIQLEDDCIIDTYLTMVANQVAYQTKVMKRKYNEINQLIFFDKAAGFLLMCGVKENDYLSIRGEIVRILSQKKPLLDDFIELFRKLITKTKERQTEEDIKKIINNIKAKPVKPIIPNPIKEE